MQYEDQVSGGYMSRAHRVPVLPRDLSGRTTTQTKAALRTIRPCRPGRSGSWQAVTPYAFGQPASNPYRMILSH